MKYMLRLRPSDNAEWEAPIEYESRAERDRDAAYARILAGYRTHSYEEREFKRQVCERQEQSK